MRVSTERWSNASKASSIRCSRQSSPTKGLQFAIQEKPDVILLDLNMPQIDGFKVCRHLQEHPTTRDIPILFLTADQNPDNLAKALDAGASDYISKPFNAIELEARVRVALRTKQMIDLLQERARIDAVTGLNNRAAMDDALVAAASAYKRTGHPVSLLMIDLDHFKKINDTYGHGVGDDVLRRVGASIRAGCRPYDVACRFGGDEFGVILAQSDTACAEQVSKRISRRNQQNQDSSGRRRDQSHLQRGAGLGRRDAERLRGRRPAQGRRRSALQRQERGPKPPGRSHTQELISRRDGSSHEIRFARGATVNPATLGRITNVIGDPRRREKGDAAPW